jgi:hypothetical protein
MAHVCRFTGAAHLLEQVMDLLREWRIPLPCGQPPQGRQFLALPGVQQLDRDRLPLPEGMNPEGLLPFRELPAMAVLAEPSDLFCLPRLDPTLFATKQKLGTLKPEPAGTASQRI